MPYKYMNQILLKNKNNYTKIDNEDYQLVDKFNWYQESDGYVRASGRIKTPIHRLIMKANKGEIIDHIDGNKLNNMKENLRICTTSQNMMNRPAPISNTSGFKGVWWHKRANKWTAGIELKGKQIHLGSFDFKKEAAKAYNNAAIKYFGEFANLNKI